MADTKITALTALTAADPANDVIPIVDVSDTTMAASGTTKKISVNNILGASGTATLASATITGAATVGTTLGVTGATNLSGALTVSTGANATPLTLTCSNAAGTTFELANTGGAGTHYFGGYNAIVGGGNATDLVINSAGQTIIRTGSTNVATFATTGLVVGVGGTTAMTLNSTGLGIGGSPRTKFDVLLSGTANTGGSLAPSLGLFTGPGLVPLIDGSRAGANVNIESNTAQGINVGASLMLGGRYADSSTASSGFAALFGGKATATTADISGYLAFYTSQSAVMNERMRLDASGNLGVGVTTFGTSAAKVLAIGTGTEPTTGPAGTVQLFTSTRSASNTIPAIFTEGSGVTNAAITNTTVTNKIAIKVNGTIYYLLATTSAA